MSELKWYDGPDLQTANEVISLVGSYRTGSLLTSYAQFLETQELATLNDFEKTVVGVEVFQREINVGGFDALDQAYLGLGLDLSDDLLLFLVAARDG
ncbi:hypothetical protein [uncultured Shimia sp.]|uniref:hypothetical protein n=1 Tax=uncultured Shimia sp. TaxID=573152 RepID=UPI00261AA9AD|nr:hypothetical protein [uncultured Shimia sp.]